MKCGINVNGDLIIEAITETEAFALTKWAAVFDADDCAIRLIIKPPGAPWSAENSVIKKHVKDLSKHSECDKNKKQATEGQSIRFLFRHGD